MNITRTVVLLTAASGLAAIATPAPAQDAGSGAPGYVDSGAQAAPTKHKKYAVAAIPSEATAEYPESNCRLEIFDTGVHWKSYQTMCGPR